MLRELQEILLLRHWRKPVGAAQWAVTILGAVIALVGVILTVGGAQLIAVGGSWYYFFAGLALILAGFALAQRKTIGAWIYVGAFVFTALWAFWEVGLNGWALVPRMVGPLVLLLLVILALPVLDSERGKRRRLYGLGGFAALAIVLGIAVGRVGVSSRPNASRARVRPGAHARGRAFTRVRHCQSTGPADHDGGAPRVHHRSCARSFPIHFTGACGL